jgi:immune inhibitor A
MVLIYIISDTMDLSENKILNNEMGEWAMKTLLGVGFSLLIGLIWMIGNPGELSAADFNHYYQAMPPNETKITQQLLERYHLTVADLNSTSQRSLNQKNGSDGMTEITVSEARAVVRNYLRRKLNGKPEDLPNRQALKRPAVNLRHGRPIAKSRFFNAAEGWNGVDLKESENLLLDKILLILVEFSDVAHNRIPQPGADNNADYWVPDFNVEHYQNILFSRKKESLSMSNYYLEQSLGTYTVDGKAYGWVRVNLPESEYGADKPDSGHDNANGQVWRIVRDAIKAAGDSVSWAEYDREDPDDRDGDGNYHEPDGYIDHLMIVHSGVGQEAGGGEQGDDAIWSHSAWANNGIHGPGLGGVPTSDPAVWAGPYTIMPEDGAIGVFCHEFAHDLGLPDEYDTLYSGEASTGFWSLMASGSWLGRPLGTRPSNISIWGRIQLGWISPKMIKYQSMPVYTTLDRKENPAIKIDLPDKNVPVQTNTPFEGKYEWFSGSGDGLNQTLTRTLDLTGISQAMLRFQSWYDIEEDYDFGYIEISSDGGKQWRSLPGNITTLVEDTHAITGKSDGWVEARFNLSKYAGSKLMLRFRYSTDGGLTLPGWAIDQISIDATGFTDNCENGNQGWTVQGWRIYEGKEIIVCKQYYLLEQRDFSGFDAGLAECYNYYGQAKTIQFFPYNPGALLWLYDGEYHDNWVGEHPGHGFLLTVDSHPNPDFIAGEPLRTRLQIRDAVFGNRPILAATLSFDSDEQGLVTKVFNSAPGNPLFNDKFSYWREDQPDNSLKVPAYGVNFRVFDLSANNSRSGVIIYFD